MISYFYKYFRAFLGAFFIFFLLFFFNESKADQFHYNNVLIGTRAVGLGGAYTAVSDDASGSYYNPAGIVFSQNNDLSASVQTFYQKHITYQNIFGQKAFNESARGAVSSFFGGLKHISSNSLLSDFSIAFAIYSPDAGLSGENFLVNNEPDAKIVRYHRSANLRTSAIYGGLAFAVKFFKTISLGMALNYFDIDELQQIYQDVRQGPFRFEESGTTDAFINLTNNDRFHLKASGIQPVAGLRVDMGAWVSFGASIRQGFLWKQEFEADSEVSSALTDVDNNILKVDSAKNPSLSGKLTRSAVHVQNSAPFVTLPTELRLGIAFHPSSLLLWTFDVSQHSGADAAIAALKRSEVVNYATGMEVRPADWIIFRGGLFTNSDATANRNVFSEYNRGEYNDFLGFSSQFSLKFKTSEYSISYVQQNGKGEAQKVQGRKNNSTGEIQLISISTSQFL